jgi:uncharacterized protein (DUF427 family)
MWKFTGKQRPDFAQTPGPGQESAWDYPRPPVLDPTDEAVLVRRGHIPIAESRSALRVLETASPPTYYLPPQDVAWNQLQEIPGSSFCEWKGHASYFALAGDTAELPVAWRYAAPTPRFEALAGYVAFYPGRLDCFVNGEAVRAQSSEFYGGWITDRVVGPFKGDPGTGHW